MEKVLSFLKFRLLALGLSFLLFIFLLSMTLYNGGLNWGIDFVGGVKIISQFEKDPGITKIRKILSTSGIDSMVQEIGAKEKNEYIISTKLISKGESSEESSVKLKDALLKGFPKVKFLSVETVGPAIGEFLKREAVKLFAVALLMMTIYLSFRFELKYAIGAMAALVHDIALAVVFCGLLKLEIDIPIIAAMLTIFGYSVNDTIVIFDRIRENVQVKSKQTFYEIINKSISQSITRSILTSLTTLFAVLALYLLGGDVINDFALTLLFGIFVGTYSSIYVASPVLLGWERFAAK